MEKTNAIAAEHVYRDGYGRTELDRPFWIVECQPCLVVLNSGHHYTDQALAQRLAEAHNAEVHGAVS